MPIVKNNWTQVVAHVKLRCYVVKIAIFGLFVQ